MAIYQYHRYDQTTRDLTKADYGESNEHYLPQDQVFPDQLFDGIPVAIMQAAQQTIHLCAHDNHKAKDISVTIRLGEELVTVKAAELLAAIALSGGRKSVIAEQSLHILGFAGTNKSQTLADVAKEEKTSNKKKEIDKQLAKKAETDLASFLGQLPQGTQE